LKNWARHHGAFAAIGSAKVTTEESYVLQKFTRAVKRSHRAFPATLGLVLTAGTDRVTVKTPVKVG